MPSGADIKRGSAPNISGDVNPPAPSVDAQPSVALRPSVGAENGNGLASSPPSPRALSGHTQTPWVVFTEDGDEDGASLRFIYGEPCCTPADVAEDHCTHEDRYEGFVCEVGSLDDPGYDSDRVRANAEYIVRAVNAHEDLVSTLYAIVEGMEASGGWPGDEDLFDRGIALLRRLGALAEGSR